MQTFVAPNEIQDAATRSMCNLLQEHSAELFLDDAVFHCDFPVYQDADGDIIPVRALLVSPSHGVIVFGTCDATESAQNVAIGQANAELEHAFSNLYGKLLKNRALRKTKTALTFDTAAVLYAPYLDQQPDHESDTEILISDSQVIAFFKSRHNQEPFDESLLDEILSTIEGSKALERPKKRDIDKNKTNTKGHQAWLVETEIAKFDRQQRRCYAKQIKGTQRIRGLAGSGKTVVLAMKAALTHIRNPDATIVYTFQTKSLYQHIQRLIGRFCRQFEDRNPDWNKLRVLHAWGGQANPGVYFEICRHHEVAPINFTDAARMSSLPFDHVCTELLKKVRPAELFDYVFVDEGQDFPASFLRLCYSVAKDGKFVWAYDELQTIFQARTPSAQEIFGVEKNGAPRVEIQDDIVLSTCYRNPREILVCAHAIGLGIYRHTPVQMLENREHWEDIGYKVLSDSFREGEQVVLERPIENSLSVISDKSGIDEIVKGAVFDTPSDEINSVVRSILGDLSDGLRPDDILVITVDDRNAKHYLGQLEQSLSTAGVQCYNVHALSFGLPDFQKDDYVTLSTVHKAKGNEAFMVYVVGVDAVFDPDTVRNRNKLFTAMTRAKGWVRVSGAGPATQAFLAELAQAKANAPKLTFKYPNPNELQVMKRDLEESSIPKIKAERLLEQALSQARSEMTEDEIEHFIRAYTQGDRKRKHFGTDESFQ